MDDEVDFSEVLEQFYFLPDEARAEILRQVESLLIGAAADE